MKFWILMLAMGVMSLGVALASVAYDVNRIKHQVNHIGERLCGDIYVCKTTDGHPYP